MGNGVNPIIFLLIPLVMVGIGLIVAFSKKGSVAGAQMGSRVLDVHTPADPDTAFAKIKGMGGLYKVDDSDPSRRVIVLSSSPTMFSWGFLYPVFIQPEGSGSSIQVGIHSKCIQWGPIVTRAHKDVIARIERALGVATARAV